MERAVTHRVIVCTTCRKGNAVPTGEAVIAEVAQRLDDRFVVEGHDCLNMCDHAQAVAFRAPGKAAYLFGDLDAGDVDDIAAFARLWADSADGWIADARPAGRLRFCLRGRIPG